MASSLDRHDRGAARRLAYSLRGEGPLVIAVPGMGDVRSADDALAAALVADGFRVAQLDLRDHGGSDVGFVEIGDAATATDIIALIEELGGPALVIGTSMAASASVLAAADRPDLVRGLVLLSPFLRDGEGDPRLMRMMFRVLFARPWGAAVWTRYYRSVITKGAAPSDHAAHVAEVRANLRRPGRLAALRRLATTLSHAEVAERVGDVRAPALAVIGALDPDYADPAAELAHAGEVLGAETLLVENAAHYPHRQRPDVVLPAIRAFAARIASSSAAPAGAARA